MINNDNFNDFYDEDQKEKLVVEEKPVKQSKAKFYLYIPALVMGLAAISILVLIIVSGFVM